MSNMVVFKLRHKETGLFCQPHQRRCNTSTVGKVYNSKPARVGFLSISKENADRLGLETVFRDYSRDFYTDLKDAEAAYKYEKERYVKEVAVIWKDKVDEKVFKSLMNWEFK